MRSAREKFLGLSAQSRSLLALSALFIFLFVVSLISIQIHKGAQQAGTKTREIIAGVEQKNDLIDASMLYDDRPRARALLSESRTLLDLVPQKFRTRADYRAAVQKIQDIDVRLNNIIHIAKPDVVASIAVDTTHTLPPLRAIAHGDTFLVYSTDTIYLLDSAKHTLNPLSNIQGKIPSISCAVSASPTLFYFCGGDGAHLYSLTLPDATVKTVSLPRDKNESSLDDVQMYNNRLYVLTKVTGTIYRHLTVSTGFSRGVAWTRQPNVMLKGARSFAIDGKVYTIGDDGSVYLFSAGTLQPRTTDATTNNALVNATHLWTDSDDPFLFALDASGKKMIAVNKKTFELSAQITSDQFSNLEGFTVNRPKKEILLLDANRIIRVPFDVK